MAANREPRTVNHKYFPYQQDVTLCKGIADIHPYQLRLPDLPEDLTTITNYGVPPEEQFFKREVIPIELKKIDQQVKSGQISRERGIELIEADPALCSFVEMLWRKRTGEQLEFQYIGGHPIHISHTYWFYLNFWEMPQIGADRPEFRHDWYHHCTDLSFFYFWDYLVCESPFCLGAVEFTQRQVGKSYKMGLILYDFPSRHYEGHSGMQSKTDEDAAKIFTKCIVKPWRKLPFFFQPICSNSTMPKAEGLSFTPRSKRGKEDSTVSLDEDELMGTVTYRASGSMAYDGDTIDRFGNDESGKTTVADVYERLTVVRESLRRRGGKAYFTTTVEEMEKMGGKFFKRLWLDSDRSPNKKSMADVKVDENGETVSGLWPWFTPSYCNEHFDQFGFSIVDKITEKQKQYLKSVAGLKKIKYWWMSGMESVDHQINMQKDQHKKQEVIRKKPRNIVEAFQSSNNFSHFNKSILNKRLGYFTYGYTPRELEYMKFGRFEWVNNVFGGDVEFIDMDYDQARGHVSFMPREGMRNQKIPMPGGKYRPANAALYRSGADPFKYDTPDVKNPSKMSDGAQHIYAFFDPTVDGNKDRKDWFTNNYVYEYLYRPESVDDLCEDYLKACIFYGCKLYPERNNDDVIKYFKKHGFEHYIQMGIRVTASVDTGIYYTQETVGGNITNDKTIQKMFRHVDDFVNNDAAYCVFHRTLQDILDVEKENLNPFDLFVSGSYTLMAAYESEIASKQEDKPGDFGAEELLELNGYDINAN